MHLLGHNLPDHKLLKVRPKRPNPIPFKNPTPDLPVHFSFPFITHDPRGLPSVDPTNKQVALTSFYGLSHSTTPRLLARLQIPNQTKVQDLTESQITQLSAFLSSPATTPSPPPTPLSSATSSTSGEVKGKDRQVDPLDGLRIETDLKRDIQGDIAHLRQVGAYRGRR
jgi:small subunit ribosomal protein S13